MSHKTPWSQSSSLLSDRVKPRNHATNSPKPKGKGKELLTQEAIKSPAVLTLETTINQLLTETGNRRDPKDGCFCLARTHDLSAYCPICTRCGLILCSLNAPCYACPHCSSSLLSSAGKEFLLERLRNDLAEVIEKEEEEADRAREEARQAAGSFPSLNSANTSQSQQAQQTQTHKVLSLNSKTKRVTVASYTPAPTPAKASTRSETKERDPSPERVPPPPYEIMLAQQPPATGRPWQDARGDGFIRPLTYTRNPRLDKEHLREERRARTKNKRIPEGEIGGNNEGPENEVEEKPTIS
ncbi:hypothetical protein ACEPAF_4266 [Sanghuangporus sanghuang]